VAVRPPGRWGHESASPAHTEPSPAKPAIAIEVTTDFGAELTPVPTANSDLFEMMGVARLPAIPF
jgi:hypothetical protein